MQLLCHAMSCHILNIDSLCFERFHDFDILCVLGVRFYWIRDDPGARLSRTQPEPVGTDRI